MSFAAMLLIGFIVIVASTGGAHLVEMAVIRRRSRP